jgi:membrane protein DedA with SNARE-associated domain
MPGMTPEGVSEFLRAWGYPAYVVLLLATAFGSPLTEDLLLLIGGYLVSAGVFTWPATGAIAYLGVLSSDLLLYTYGRKLREHSLRRGFIRRMIRPGRLRVATRWFARFGDWLVIIARLVPGTRMLVFVSAGVRAMSVWRFLLLDGLPAALWVPALLIAGERLGRHIGHFNRILQFIADRIPWIVVAMLVVYGLRRAWLRGERRLTGAPDSKP